MKGYLKRNSAAYFHNAVKNAKSIAILTHTNPDGDALGSVTALKWYLAALGINSRIVVPNPYPKNLKFLDRDGDVIIHSWRREAAERTVINADLIIALAAIALGFLRDLSKFISVSLMVTAFSLPEEE